MPGYTPAVDTPHTPRPTRTALRRRHGRGGHRVGRRARAATGTRGERRPPRHTAQCPLARQTRTPRRVACSADELQPALTLLAPPPIDPHRWENVLPQRGIKLASLARRAHDSAFRTNHRLANISSKFSSTLPTTVHAASSTRSTPGGSGPSGCVASCSACFGSLR